MPGVVFWALIVRKMLQLQGDNIYVKKFSKFCHRELASLLFVFTQLSQEGNERVTGVQTQCSFFFDFLSQALVIKLFFFLSYSHGIQVAKKLRAASDLFAFIGRVVREDK